MRTEHLTKCFEPLQKQKTRLGTVKSVEAHSVILITDRYMVVLLLYFSDACFDVSFCAVLNLYASR